MSTAQFAGTDLRPVQLAGCAPMRVVGLALGKGPQALEVLVLDGSSAPSKQHVQTLWKHRHGGRAAPLMLVALHADHATLCGPVGDDPPVFAAVDRGQVERICQEALDQPDRHAALRCLRDALPAVASNLPGVRNEGFLATHELERGIRQPGPWQSEWSAAQPKARAILGRRGDDLLRSLGFRIDPNDQVTSILRAGDGGRRTAVAVLLQQSESPDLHTPRFGDLSPVSYALAVADRENLPYVVLSQGAKLRLYPVKQGVGVGRRGPAETYVEVHTGLLRDSDAAYLWLLFSADALVDNGTLEKLLSDSKRFSGDLAERLRTRIYDEVVPRLAEGLAAARFGSRGRLSRAPTATELAETYEMAMTVLFRLLFIAYAEDKDLLPYKHNESYRDRSLKRKAEELVRMHAQETAFDDTDSYWTEINLLFAAVRDGKRQWGVPAYDGGLFENNAEDSPIGALLDGVTLPNQTFGTALRDLLTIQSREGWGPVDFRSLGVREFGTVYEGLLESELAVADTDLTYEETGKNKGIYRPARRGEEVKVRQRRIYLHDRSGARKSTGTYFTKEFAVEHLLDRALDPALADHLKRLDALDDDAAAQRFFDFRVADIAMGSGHFLVAAVDHIERAFRQYVARRALPGVRAELAKLRASAVEALGGLADQVEIEDTQLLRRLIARRCIYGVDINPVSVQLARLSIWIHTFVPGLPLSLLDHNLIVGNSLVGIARVSEIEDLARDSDLPLFSIETDRLVGEALEPLQRLARAADVTAAEIKRARKAIAEARERTKPAEALCDIVAACRMLGERFTLDLSDWDRLMASIVDSRAHRSARDQLEELDPLHFPVAFPEVFLRERSGFDVIVGNPPWQEATLEEHAFWARHFPGLRSLNQRAQEDEKARLRRARSDLVDAYEKELAESEAMRKALTSGPFPGMGTGDPDLYKAFCWRFWTLVTQPCGRIGVVLPRDCWVTKGSTEYRHAVFSRSTRIEVIALINRGGWVFPGVHEQNPVPTLNSIEKANSDNNARIELRGPFRSLDAFLRGSSQPPITYDACDIRTWTDTESLPLLPAEESLDVFARLRQSPRLNLDTPGQWRARPHTELHATNDKMYMDLDSEERPRGFWPVYKGESFDIWQPDTGRYYAWADPRKMILHLHQKTLRGTSLKSSAFCEFEPRSYTKPESLPCYSPRVAFRDITNGRNRRTVIAALVPPKVFITNKGPYFLWPRGDERDQAFLLGALASIPLDWYARRFVEKNINFFIINPFPIPRPGRSNPLWQRAVALAGRLAAVDDLYGDWARAVGVECGPLPDERKYDMICELDAVVAHLYGLEQKHLTHIFETFHEGWEPGTTAKHPTLGEYSSRLKATIAHFKRLGR